MTDNNDLIYIYVNHLAEDIPVDAAAYMTTNPFQVASQNSEVIAGGVHNMSNSFRTNLTKVAPLGTDLLPLAERLRVYIEVFESGCSNTYMEPDLRPEDCPECVRSFVAAVKKAVAYSTVPAVHDPLDVRRESTQDVF